MQWLTTNLPLILGVLLAISEGLSLLFPASTGAGGILAGIVKVLKALGAKEPGAQA